MSVPLVLEAVRGLVLVGMFLVVLFGSTTVAEVLVGALEDRVGSVGRVGTVIRWLFVFAATFLAALAVQWLLDAL